MAKNTNVEKLCDRELLEKILSIVERQEKLPPPIQESGHCLYDNKSLTEKLHIKEKYLKKLRTNGYLGYSREGDKHWYTQADVDHFCAVSTTRRLPPASCRPNRKEVLMYDRL